MKNAKRVIMLVSILLLSLGLSTSCLLIGDNFKIRDLISYIDKNKESDEKYDGAHIYDEHAQKSIFISFSNIDTVKEADEIIRLINKYLVDHPEYFLNQDFYICVKMSSVRNAYSHSFSCTNSMEYYSPESKDHKNKTVLIEEDLCQLIVNGVTMGSEELKISKFDGLFSDIKSLVLSDNVVLDDLSVFGTFESLEAVNLALSSGQISDETIAQLKEMYPEIEFS